MTYGRVRHRQPAARIDAMNPKERDHDVDRFDEAILDMDGHVLETTGSCKEGMDISYNGKWGYHALLVSLANTQEVLSIFNRPGNWTSQQRLVGFIERAIGLCRRAGFRRILLRGDIKFSQTEHFDRWDTHATIRTSCSSDRR